MFSRSDLSFFSLPFESLQFHVNTMHAPAQSAASNLEVLNGTLARENWRPRDAAATKSLYVIASLEDGTSVIGDAEPGDLIPGMSYRFFGKWEQSRKPKNGKTYGNGKTFRFRNFTKAEPLSARGLVLYLQRYAPGVGPRIAQRIYDRFGQDSCRTLRSDPAAVAHEVPGLSLEKAREASAALSALAATEDVKIELTNLLAGRGFPGRLVDLAIDRWGVLAPKRIQRDPFCLLLAELPGAGFLRCDRLYGDLGLPPGRLRRQMICVWHALASDNEGHTWFSWGSVDQKLKAAICGAAPRLERAIQLGIRTGLLAVRTDSNGQRWVANATAAKNEQEVAKCLARLMRVQRPVVLPLFTEALPGECTAEDADYSPEALEKLGTMPDLPDNVAPWKVPELMRIGRETGICQVCGRRLVNPESLARGIGPVCAERLGMIHEN